MNKNELTQEYVRSLFDYDPLTGYLTWKIRPLSHFQDEGAWKRMNIRCAGKRVGSFLKKGSSYLVVNIGGVKYLLHRLIWVYVYGEFPEMVDHINGIGSDNRLSNLRDVDRVGNQRNQKRPVTNKSGVIGVCWHKAAQLWVAQISDRGKRIYLGSDKDVNVVIAIRKKAEIEYGFHENHGRA